MSINVQPLGDYVVAVPSQPQTKTASGLYIPGTAAEKPKIAKVMAVGPRAAQVKAGDQIIYKESYDGTAQVKLEKAEYLLIKEDNILATVN